MNANRRRFVPIVAGLVAVTVVLATVITAISLVGTPAQARKEAADRQRVADLLSIADKVRGYYRVKRKAPKDLPELIRYFQLHWLATEDPITKEPYGYRRLDDTRYELSAVFETDQSKKELTEWDYRHLSAARRAIHLHPRGRARFVIDARKDSEGYD